MTTFIVSVDHETCDQFYQKIIMLGSHVHLNDVATCEGKIVTASYDMYS